jgi:hypothetical protein
MSGEVPSHRLTRTLENVRYDPTEVERERRKKRIEEIPQQLRWEIDASLEKRIQIRRVKSP